ncbi:PREDICTED: apoptosis-inducing factor 1, mitochondrial-like [Amphimedon queenslandica]|uniref:FAD/NAD(P)-binding domain-containing protein n=1 Tax=Amphimedon queenslandica TaxID=400682 RepID=A0A1X7V5H3_AMPQE|nr:PREDICTED: apoptosis-inducing factor 1, mitochondrial-like [Amphimedon queenslandica]|eukprot:XP_003385522.1 PREDICTED: apoptosis-inducing factor 1, mitochondrial-like [Amphimedon queenslandica]
MAAAFLRVARSSRVLWGARAGPSIYKAYASSSSSTSSSFFSTNTLITLAGVTVAGVGAYGFYQNSKPSPYVGSSGMQYTKATEYQKEGATHPEAEAEKNLESAQETSTPPAPASSPAPPPPADIPDFAPYVLIGAGTTSFAAAKAIREKDPTAKVLIIGNEDYTPYSRPPLSKQLWLYEDHEAAKNLKFTASWSGGKVVDVFYKADFCSPKDLPNLEGGGIAVVTGRKVTSLDTRKKKIRLDNGSEVSFNKCLLATGGTPKTLPVFQGKGPFSTFRAIPDYKALDKLLDSAKSILIVGGGFLGSELAVGLASRGKDKGVTISQVFPEVGNLGLVLPQDVSKWTTDKVREVGVQVHPGTGIKSASVSEDGKKVTVVTDNGTELVADHVVVAVGLQPNTDLATSARLEIDKEHGGFKVNSELLACTDVWAAGDVASFYDPYLGRRRVEHHDHANVSGRLAGYNMTGEHQPFMHQSMFWSDIGPDVGFEATGLIDSKLPTVGVWGRKSSEAVDTPVDDYSKGVIYYLDKEGGRIVGVLTWNIFGKMDVARQIISEEKTEVDISDIVQHFEIH